jgi:hypothetical protein
VSNQGLKVILIFFFPGIWLFRDSACACGVLGARCMRFCAEKRFETLEK